MSRIRKIIIMSTMALLLGVLVFNIYFILSTLYNNGFFSNLDKSLNTTDEYKNKTDELNITDGGIVEITDIYSPIKISFSYTLDEKFVNNSNVKLFDSKSNDIPINITPSENKQSFYIIPEDGSFIDDSDYTLIVKKDLKGVDGKKLAKDVEYSVSIERIYLGSDLFLTDKYKQFFLRKNIGLITNQTGIDSEGESTFDKIHNDKNMHLATIFAPEHGLNGNESLDDYIDSYFEDSHGIKVYNLYGPTRDLTEEMLYNINVLIFDIQDIGIRTYTYISTLYKSMEAAKEKGIEIYVLDRPNPLGGKIVEGPMIEKEYESFIGIDILPMAHGMTIGEIANYFNRNIKCDLKVIPMLGWHRDMTYKDCNLEFMYTSPNIKDINSMFLYGTTGLGEGTGLKMVDKFNGVKLRGIDMNELAKKMNEADLPGVSFTVEDDEYGEDYVRVNIIDFKEYNPVKTGMYLLSYARIVGEDNFTVPVTKEFSNDKVMFEKVMGGNKIGKMLLEYRTPEDIISSYASDVNKFKIEREKYLIYK